MNVAYRRLCEVLPERGEAPRAPFPVDAKRVSTWVDALPRANQHSVLQQLDEAFASLNAQRCDAGQRLAALELMRPIALESAALLRKALAGASFPLSDAHARAAKQAHRLHGHLVEGYQRVVVDYCASAGAVPFLRGGAVATAMQRAIYHGGRRLFLGYWLYLSPAQNVWRDLHAMYGFACSAKLDGKSVNDAASDGGSSTVQVYGQAVLLALSNPYRFSQREQESLIPLCDDLARSCRFVETECDKGCFAVAIAGDFVPNQPLPEQTDDVDSIELRWFDISAMSTIVDQALGDTRDGEVMIRPANARSLVVSADLLRRLSAGWVPVAARGHQRIHAGHSLDTVVGLSGLHYQLAQGQTFDGFMQRLSGARLGGGSERAAWTHSPGIDGLRTQVAEAKVLDQSLGGYRLRWLAENQVRARVGELIGLSVSGGEDLHNWMVGVVRWLRYDPDGGMYAGVALLARRAQAIGVRVLDINGVARPAQRGIRLQPLSGQQEGEWTLLVPSVINPESRLEVAFPGDMDDYESSEPSLLRMQPRRVLENAGDYLILAATPSHLEVVA